jgi:hypothetical protein
MTETLFPSIPGSEYNACSVLLKTIRGDFIGETYCVNFTLYVLQFT